MKSTQQPKWVKIDIKPSYILLKKASSITLLLSKDGGLGRRGGTLFIGLNGSEFKTNCLARIIEFVKSHLHWKCGKKRRTYVAKVSCKSQCFTAKYCLRCVLQKQADTQVEKQKTRTASEAVFSLF